MSILFLIRHAPVSAQLNLPSDQWQLSAEGQVLAEQLAMLPIFHNLHVVCTSPEPKARLNGLPLARRYGVPMVEQPDLGELRRGGSNISGQAAYEAAVQAALMEPEIAMRGWEAAAQAQRRIVACVKTLAEQHPHPVALVSHGMVLSLLVAHLQNQARVDVAGWRALPLPALAVVDTASWHITTPFRSLVDWQASIDEMQLDKEHAGLQLPTQP